MNGLLLVDKPEGLTSADVVRVVKRRTHSKTGHLGTLDPFASGVLPLCLGEGTKIAQFLNTADKEYTGVIRLGSETDTGDPTGTVIRTAPAPGLVAARLHEVSRQFQGEMLQIPPMYSALKHHGMPLYKLARRGVEVERAPRRVWIERLALEIDDPTGVRFTVACSKGTYVRVLAQQVAEALGSVGHLERLRRTRFGPFRVEEAITLQSLEAESIPIIPLRAALRDLREIRLDAAAAQRACRGYEPLLTKLAPGTDRELVKLIGPTGELTAIIVMDQPNRWRFARVFAPPTSEVPL